MLRPLFALVTCAGLLVVGTGCAHYQLGAGAKPTFTTLYVEPVTTKILLPQSQATLETQIRAAFVRDGRVTLVNSPEAAEATLKLHLIDYRRDAYTDSGKTLPSGTVVSGQLQAEYQTLPLLAEALAAKVTHAVLDVW